MLKPKIFDRQFEGKYLPRRINENRWFDQQQDLLLWMANTDYGRDLLCIDKRLPRIIGLKKNVATGLLETHKNKDGTYRVQKISDFRIGAKWANIIRCRWPEFQAYAQEYYRTQNVGWNMPILFPVVKPTFVHAYYTTSTFYPDPDPESTTVDGSVAQDYGAEGNGQTWATIRGAAGNDHQDASTNREIFQTAADNSGNKWLSMYRGVFLFDTSSIGDTDTKDSGTFSINGTTTGYLDNFNQSVVLTNSAPDSNTDLVNGDYNNDMATEYNSARLDVTSWNQSGYNDWTLNATALTAISATGVSKLGTRGSGDFDNAEPTWAASTTARVFGNYADLAGTTSDPKLVIVHTAAAVGGGGRRRMLMGIGS